MDAPKVKVFGGASGASNAFHMDTLNGAPKVKIFGGASCARRLCNIATSGGAEVG